MHDQLTPPPPHLLQIVPRLLHANLSIFKVAVTAAHVEMWLQAFFTALCFWCSNIQLKSLSSVNTGVRVILITVIVQNNTGRTAFPPLTGSYHSLFSFQLQDCRLPCVNCETSEVQVVIFLWPYQAVLLDVSSSFVPVWLLNGQLAYWCHTQLRIISSILDYICGWNMLQNKGEGVNEASLTQLKLKQVILVQYSRFLALRH